MWQVASALISQLARDCNFNLTNAQSTKVEHGESHLINLEVNSKTLGMRLQFWGGILAQCLTNCKTHGKDHKLAARLTKSSTATEAYTKFNANRQGKLLSTVYTQTQTHTHTHTHTPVNSVCNNVAGKLCYSLRAF